MAMSEAVVKEKFSLGMEDWYDDDSEDFLPPRAKMPASRFPKKGSLIVSMSLAMKKPEEERKGHHPEEHREE